MNFTINTYQLVEDSFIQGTKYVNRYFNCRLKDETSLLTPIFRVKENNKDYLSNINYIYVEQIKTYYFVKDIVFLDNGNIEIYCVVDLYRKGE